jgi:hypothetical protein
MGMFQIRIASCMKLVLTSKNVSLKLVVMKTNITHINDKQTSQRRTRLHKIWSDNVNI